MGPRLSKLGRPIGECMRIIRRPFAVEQIQIEAIHAEDCPGWHAAGNLTARHRDEA